MSIKSSVTIPKSSVFLRFRQWFSHWLSEWAPALPLLFIAFALLVAPIAWMIVRSFFNDAGAFTLENWIKTFSSKADQQAIITSLKLAATCATISLTVGGPLAWIISQMTSVPRSTWLALFNVVTNFGGIGLAFAYIATLGTLGMVTLALKQINAPFAPPAPGTFWGLVIAYEYSNIPLFVLLTLPAMGILKKDWWEAAQTASATRGQFWRMVGLPILFPFLGAGWLLIFTWAIGMYALPFALSGAAYSGKIRLITLQMALALQRSFTGPGEVAVLAVVLLVIASTSLLAYRYLLRRAVRWAS